MQKLGITWESIQTSATTTLVRSKVFSAGHRYFNSGLSEAENQNLYGKLYRKDGFGHNFRVEVSFAATADRLSGMILNLSIIDRVLGKTLGQLDHFYLNDLKLMEPVTLESIAAWIGQSVRKELTEGLVARVRVYEGEQTWVDYIP